MEALIQQFVQSLPLSLLFVYIAVSLSVLGKSADLLVDEAVDLSVRWGIPKFVVGSTIVSIGTTTPEAAVSVLAALRGKPDLALGNAVGSVICNMGLIMGLGILIEPPILERQFVYRQGWIQLGTALLLVIVSLPWRAPGSAFTDGGRLPEWAGFLFLGLLAAYLWYSIRRTSERRATYSTRQETSKEAGTGLFVLMKLIGAVSLVVGSSWVLIPGVQEAALRLKVAEGIIAATIVAFGTSLPELVTMVRASWRGHGELGAGNVIGANILNVLFVAGASAAVTAGGLIAAVHFFRLLFFLMLFVLLVFQVGILYSGARLRRPVGVLLLATYLLTVTFSYS